MSAIPDSAADRWERRLGIIVPSWNTVMELECQRMAAGILSVHSERIRHTADTEENLLWMATQVPAAATLLAHAKVDVICYGCTAGGFLKPPADDRALAAGIEATTGIPGVSSAAAIADALRAMGARRVSVASPYEPWLNARVKTYLEADGFDVCAIEGLGTQAHAAVTTDRIVALAASVVRPETEALFISCSNFRTVGLVASLETRFGIPVVTSNQASMWKMLRRIDDHREIPAAGRLFREA